MTEIVGVPVANATCRVEDLPIDVGIKAKIVGGETLRSFLGATAPMPDESLMGWLARIGALNAHRSLCQSLDKVGIVTPRPESLAGSRRCDGEALAFLLKADTIDVVTRGCPDTPTDAAGRRIDFFGVPIRPSYRNVKVRRVAPRALLQDDYHRAIWELRPLTFDPATMETLIHTCPVCGHRLGWVRTFGVSFCDVCMDRNRRPTVDLRDFPQPLVEVEDMEALRFVASLVDPARSEPTLWGAALPEAVSGFSRGNLFDLAVVLAGALTYESLPAQAREKKFNPDKHVIGLPPEHLALAGRAILDWPHGFFTLTGILRLNSDDRHEAFGVDKELGCLRRLVRRSDLPEVSRGLLKAGIDEDLRRSDGAAMILRRGRFRSDTRINVRDAKKSYGFITRKLVGLAASGEVSAVRHSRLVCFDRAEIDAVAAARKDMIGGVRTAGLLGVPLGALPDLTAKGLIERETGPATVLFEEKEQYRRSSVDALVAAMKVRIGQDQIDGDQRLSLAASRVFVGQKPWGAIVAAVRDGALAVRRGANRKGGLLDRVAADPREVDRVVAGAGSPVPADPDGRTNYPEASVYFGVSIEAFSELTAAGLLPARDCINLRLRRGDLDNFASEFAFTEEIARRLGMTKVDTKAHLEGCRLRPRATMAAGKFQVWARGEVEPLLPRLQGAFRVARAPP